jgi:hypothetical protein
MLNTNVHFQHKYRFGVSTAVNATLISTDQLGAIAGGAVINVATKGCQPIARTGKLISVEVWAPPPSIGANSYVAVEWSPGQRSPTTEYTDISINVSSPAHVKTRPPKSSLAAFWFDSSTSVGLFSLTAPVGAIVDVTVQYVMEDQVALTSAPFTALTAPALGILRYACLDVNTGSFIVPIGLTA